MLLEEKKKKKKRKKRIILPVQNARIMEYDSKCTASLLHVTVSLIASQWVPEHFHGTMVLNALTSL